jgi:hypothetical protein
VSHAVLLDELITFLILRVLVSVGSIGHSDQNEEENEGDNGLNYSNVVVSYANEKPDVSKEGKGASNAEDTHVVNLLHSSGNAWVFLFIGVVLRIDSVDRHS